MFKCKICGKNSQSGERSHKLTLKSRERSYTNKRVIEDEEGKRKVIIKNSEGWEIVKEILACQECYDKDCAANNAACVRKN